MSLVCACTSEPNRHSRADIRFAVDFQLGTVKSADVLDDCKPQSGAAGALGAGFVHPVEALTQARQMLPRNADARVTDSQHGVPGCLADGDVDAPARLIVVCLLYTSPSPRD